MPAPEDETADPAGISSPEEGDLDLAALFARLKEEVRKGSGLPPVHGREAPVRLSARMDAERLWPITAERPLEGRPGLHGLVARPVKAVLRRLMRWYVEPVAHDQRQLNDAVLKLIDDLEERVAALERSRRPS